MKYIARTLTYKGESDNLKSIADDDLLSIEESVVILAEPGMGKTSLLEYLDNSDNTIKFTASSFVRRPLDRLTNMRNKTLLIDALDEYQADSNSNSIDNILAKLYNLGSPRFILTCREIEWNEASNSVFKDFYDEEPIVAHIEAFTRDDAIKFLTEHDNFDGNAEDIVFQLDELNLSDFYENPLTLKLLAHINIDNLPDNRADIFSLATKNLWQEINDSALNKLQQTDGRVVIDCAGFICATLLLSQKQNIFTGNIAKTPEDALSIHKLKNIFDENLLSNTIKCRIFKRSLNSQNFKPMHRTIAEFLGAKWLAKEMSDPIIRKKLLEQFTYKNGVPSSLRGMFSWLAYFNFDLTQIVIDTDPYGLIAYADTSFFNDSQSKLLYTSLKKLTEVNPWFRRDNWHVIKAQGLAKPCLIDEYRQLLSDKESNFSLRLSIIQILQDADFVNELSSELIAIMMDSTYRYSERSVAFQLIYDKNITVNWSEILNKLTASTLEDDLKLVHELIFRDSYLIITDEQVIRFLLNAQPLRECTDRISYLAFNNSDYKYFSEFPEERILMFVEKLIETIQQLNIPQFEEGIETSQNIIRIILSLFKKYIIKFEKNIPIIFFYDCISLFTQFETGITGSEYNEYKVFFDGYFHINQQDTITLQTIIIDNEENINLIFGDLKNSVLSSTYPNIKNLPILLEHIQNKVKNEHNIKIWKTLVFMSIIHNSIPIIVQETIKPYIEDDIDLSDFIQIQSRPRVKEDWEIKQEVRASERKLSTKLYHQSIRDKLETNISKLEVGDIEYCYQPARILLTGFSNVPSNLRHLEKLDYILTEKLCASAIIGFENSLTNNIPTPSDFVVNEHAQIEAVLIAGIYCRLLNNKPIDDLNDNIILSIAIIIEFNDFLCFDYDYKIRLSEKIKNEVISRNLKDKLIETLVVTQFERGYNQIYGLRWLTHTGVTDKDTDKIVELLEKYNKLNQDLQKNLIMTLVHNESIYKLEKYLRLKILSIEKLNEHNNVEIVSFWFALYSYIDPLDYLIKIGYFNNPIEVFWQLSEIYQNTRGYKQLVCDIQLKIWIINTFNKTFINRERPEGFSSGIRNPWQATDFINSLLTSLSNTPTDEAYQFLKKIQLSIHTSYKEHVKYLLANQQNKIREYRYVPSTLESLLSIYQNEAPQNCKDLKVLVIILLDEIQAEIYGSETDPHKAFYQCIKKDEKSIPHGENDCRDRLAYFLKLKLQTYGFKLETERDMPDDKRADMVCSHANLHLPIEVKGQWHKDLWTAMNDQLGDLYLKEHQSQRKGIYLVFWFGQNVVTRRSLHSTAFNKTGISERPKSAKELKSLLDDRIEDKYKGDIEIYVMDISRD